MQSLSELVGRDTTCAAAGEGEVGVGRGGGGAREGTMKEHPE